MRDQRNQNTQSLESVVLSSSKPGRLTIVHPPWARTTTFLPSSTLLIKSVAVLAVQNRLSSVRTRATGSLCVGVEGSWSWHYWSPGLTKYFLPLVHFSTVLREFVLSLEAIAFSVILASDLRAFEFGGILAVPGDSVADEVQPTPRAETAILDSAGEWGYGVLVILPEMGLLVHCTTPRDVLVYLVVPPRVKPAASEVTSSFRMPVPITDTDSKTHNAGTFLGDAYTR